MGSRLENKIAIVTGAGSIGPGWGNGKAAAALYAREGAQVLLVDRDADAAEETREIIEREGGACHTAVADVSKAEGVDHFVGECVGRFGGVDILHNNVGIGVVADLLDAQEKHWDLVYQVNVKSMFLACQRVIPIMRDRGGGSIINISSIASMRWTGVHYAAYSSSKAAVNQLTQSVALEHALDNIRANVIVVGYMDTPTVYAGQTNKEDADAVRRLAEKRAAACPLGRMGDAWDVAKAALFLASDESSYVTGTQLVVDGGLSAVCDR
jgi:NAD(P)-dependent dehydrogenase (short-subunit alcohol dehydrogenase family)